MQTTEGMNKWVNEWINEMMNKYENTPIIILVIKRLCSKRKVDYVLWSEWICKWNDLNNKQTNERMNKWMSI